VLPKLGRLPIEDLDQNDIKAALASIWHEKPETAEKAITRLKVILKHAVAMGLGVDLQATDKARVLLGKSYHGGRPSTSRPCRGRRSPRFTRR
jgi:hypothetical protein